MKYNVDAWNDFCRVFELPEQFSSKFCFGGGIPTNFQMVDWFCPVGMGQPAVTKDVWEKEVGLIEAKEIDHQELMVKLVEFLKPKQYIKENRKYLVICDFGMAFVFDGPKIEFGE